MKTTCSIELLLPLLLLASCDKTSESEFGGETGMHSIAYLKSLCGAAAVPVRQDITVRGRITGNDRYGEFYKTLVLEDASGGISIAADHDALADEYPFALEVTVHCNGLTLYDYGGKILLGTTPGDDGIGRIAQQDLARYLRAELPDGTLPRPAPVAIPQITLHHTDMYVRLDNVRFADAGTWCDTDPDTHRSITTEHRIVDTAGNGFTVRTAGTCTYAKLPVPSGTGTLCGIIDYFNGKFTLRITNCEAEFVSAATSPTADPSVAGYSFPKPTK